MKGGVYCLPLSVSPVKASPSTWLGVGLRARGRVGMRVRVRGRGKSRGGARVRVKASPSTSNFLRPSLYFLESFSAESSG